MKKLTKVLALVLALTCIFSLVACSKQGGKIDGSWTYTLDFEKALNAAAESSDLKEMGADQYLSESVTALLKKLSLKLNIDLKADNTFVATIDEASLRDSFQTLKAGLPEVLPGLMASIFGGSEEELKKQFEESGESMDKIVDSMLEQYGIDVDKVVESASKEKLEGTYKFEEGKLYFAEKGKEIVDTQYLVAEVSGDTLKITDIVGIEKTEDIKPMLPLELKR